MNATRSGLIYVAGNMLSAGVPFLLLPLLTRVLSPAEYGAVINFFLLVTACTAFAGLGVHGAIGVSWFKEKFVDHQRIVGAALVVAVASTLLVAALVAAIVTALPRDFLGFGPAVAALAALVAGSNTILQCRLVLWQSQHRPMANAGLQFSASALNVALSLIGVLLLHGGGKGRILGAAIATLLIALVAVCLLFRSGQAHLELRLPDVKGLIAFGAPLIPHSLAGVMLTNADRFVVSAMLGPATLGPYGAAAQLGAVMALLADAFVKAFNPWLFARLARRDPGDELRVVGAIYAAVPVFVGVAVVVAVMLAVAGGVLLGPSYRSALGIVPWFILGGAFSGVYLAVSGLYFYNGRTAVLSSVSFPTALIGLLATTVLGFRFGVSGAAMGYALTQGMLAMAAWIVAQKAFVLPWNRPRMAMTTWWRCAFAADRALSQDRAT